MSTALIGIGANLGDRRENVRRALALLADTPGIEVVASSRLYGSQPVGGPHGQGNYVNAAAVLQTSLAPHALLDVLQKVEAQLGRTRMQRWAPRTMDLDLLLFDHETIEDDDLTLPHPRMSFRRFVLQPAAEIAPEMVHPVTASRIDELLARLEQGPHYAAIGGVNRKLQTRLAQRIGDALDCPLVLDENQLVSPPSGEAAVQSLARVLHWAELVGHVAWSANPRLQPLLAPIAGTSKNALETLPAISNFWFEEWRLWECLYAADETARSTTPHGSRKLLQRLAEISRSVLSPRLVIWVDTPARHSGGIEGRWSSCLAEMFRNSPCGPLLRLDTDDRESMLAESIAAIKAMQPLEGDVS